MSVDHHEAHDAPHGPDLYRLDRTLMGERLVPVARAVDATHAGVAWVRSLMNAHAREVTALAAERDGLERRVRELEVQLDRALRQVDQATAVSARLRGEADRAATAVRHLAEKNAEVIGEKRRLRDALTGKTPLPHVHYRIECDRDDHAYEQTVVTLDTFPHKDHARQALADARRIAARHEGRVRQVRLDTVAWRAVIQRGIQE